MSHWSSNFVQTNGIRLHYHRTGRDKPSLVLAHGITDDGLCWTPIAQALEADYDVIMVSARGHGLSDKPKTGYSPQHHADDLAGLIEALALNEATLMGHSMGAAAVALVAGKYPQLVSRLILEDPSWRHEETVETAEARKSEQAWLAEWRQSIEENRTKSHDDLIAIIRQDCPTWAAAEYGPWAESKRLVSPNVLEFLTAQPLWEANIPKITCPTLLITANPELGAVVTEEVAQQVLGMNKTIERLHIKSAGHNIRREAYDAFMAGVTRFLKNM